MRRPGVQLCKLSTLLLSLTVLAHTQQPKVTVHFTQTHAHRGDNVTFECRVQNKGGGSVAIVKEVMRGDSALSPRNEQIATDDYLHPNYRATNRHELRRIATNREVDLYFLHIYTVNEEDTAKYSCNVIGTRSGASTEFQVFKEPSYVGFRNHTNGETMVFEEGRPRRLQCFADDVVPLPIMHIQLAAHDYTRQFQTDTAIDPQCYRGDTHSRGCVLHYAYNKSLHHSAFQPAYYDHGKRLICNVTVPLANYPPIITQVTVHVLFAPKFNCTKTYRATLHAQNFMMTCRVLYNPPLIDGVTLSAFGGGLNIKSGVSREGITLSEHILSPTEREVTVTIEDVMSKHFGSYSLRAANNRGSQTTNLLLGRVGYDLSSRAAMTFRATWSLPLFIMVLTLSFH